MGEKSGMVEDIEKLAHDCHVASTVASALEQDEDFIRVLKSVKAYANVYAFKYRRKSETAIYKKVLRKKKQLAEEGKPEESNNYWADTVTDAWGGRYVTLYQSEIPPIVRGLLAAIMKFNETTDAPIVMKDFVVYTNRPEKDPLSFSDDTIEIVKNSMWHDIISDGNNIKRPEYKKSAYSSVHFIFEREVTISLVGDENKDCVAKFEIQIRDIFEEGWGEIQHQLLYNGKDSIDTDEAVVDSSNVWHLHLNALKTFVDGCSQHASIIKKTRDLFLNSSLPTLENLGKAYRPFDYVNILKSVHNIKKADRKYLEDVFSRLAGAEIEHDAKVRLSKLKSAEARTLEAIHLSKELKLYDKDIGGNMKFGQLLRSELAVCKFNGADAISRILDCEEDSRDYLGDAAKIFQELYIESSDHPYIAWWHARTFYRSNSNQEAISQTVEILNKALVCVENSEETEASSWMKMNILNLKGNVTWILASKYSIGSADEVASIYDKAVNITKDALEVYFSLSKLSASLSHLKLMAHKASSNILYYIGSFCLENNILSSNHKADLMVQLEFLENLKLERTQDFFKSRDNIMIAHQALGNLPVARQLAYENFEELRANAQNRLGRPLLEMGDIKSHLVQVERPSFESAAKLLFPGEVGGRA